MRGVTCLYSQGPGEFTSHSKLYSVPDGHQVHGDPPRLPGTRAPAGTKAQTTEGTRRAPRPRRPTEHTRHRAPASTKARAPDGHQATEANHAYQAPGRQQAPRQRSGTSGHQRSCPGTTEAIPGYQRGQELGKNTYSQKAHFWGIKHLSLRTPSVGYISCTPVHTLRFGCLGI